MLHWKSDLTLALKLELAFKLMLVKHLIEQERRVLLLQLRRICLGQVSEQFPIKLMFTKLVRQYELAISWSCRMVNYSKLSVLRIPPSGFEKNPMPRSKLILRLLVEATDDLSFPWKSAWLSVRFSKNILSLDTWNVTAITFEYN